MTAKHPHSTELSPALISSPFLSTLVFDRVAVVAGGCPGDDWTDGFTNDGFTDCGVADGDCETDGTVVDDGLLMSSSFNLHVFS